VASITVTVHISNALSTFLAAPYLALQALQALQALYVMPDRGGG